MPEWTIGDVVDAIADALVVGRPSERWGEEIVAIVALRENSAVTCEMLREHCSSRLARFKTPKDVMFVDEVRRLGNGKADYWWTKARAAQRVEMA